MEFTEDDTFNALKRTPIREMVCHYDDWVLTKGAENINSVCERHGWEWFQFLSAFARWRIENPELNSARNVKYGI